MKLYLIRHISALSQKKNVLVQNQIINKVKFDGIHSLDNDERHLEILAEDTIMGVKQFKTKRKKQTKSFEVEDILLQQHILPTLVTANLECHYFVEVHFKHKGLIGSSEQIPPLVFPVKIISQDFNEKLLEG